MKPTITAATLAATALLIGACSADDGTVETSDSSTAPATSSPAAAAEQANEDTAETAVKTAEDKEDQSSGPHREASLPNGETRLVDEVVDLSDLMPVSQAPDAALNATDCVDGWPETQAFLLRAYWGAGPDGTEDIHNYADGATAGPTCFTEGTYTVDEPGYRLAHHACQSSNTTARYMVQAPGFDAVWTEEVTSGEDRHCLAFEQGEVMVYAVEVTEAS